MKSKKKLNVYYINKNKDLKKGHKRGYIYKKLNKNKKIKTLSDKLIQF